METSDQDFIIHVTVEVDHPKPFDYLSVVTKVPAAVARSMPAPDLLESDMIGSLVRDASEGQIIREILHMEAHDYRRALKRGEQMPDLPGYRVVGFALVSTGQVKHQPDAYLRLAQMYRSIVEESYATD